MPDDKKAALHPAYRDTRYHTAQIEITGRKMRSLPELGNQCQLCFSQTIQKSKLIEHDCDCESKPSLLQQCAVPYNSAKAQENILTIYCYHYYSYVY